MDKIIDLKDVFKNKRIENLFKDELKKLQLDDSIIDYNNINDKFIESFKNEWNNCQDEMKNVVVHLKLDEETYEENLKQVQYLKEKYIAKIASYIFLVCAYKYYVIKH